MLELEEIVSLLKDSLRHTSANYAYDFHLHSSLNPNLAEFHQQGQMFPL